MFLARVGVSKKLADKIKLASGGMGVLAVAEVPNRAHHLRR
jgi:hypothetical protein